MSPTPRPPVFPRIASIYGSNLGPEATGVELQMLARYDLLIGGLHVPSDAAGRSKLNANIKRLRELNPAVVVLDFAASAPYWRTGDPAVPEEAFLHTADGRRITGWPGTQMLNLSRPEAVSLLADSVLKRVEGLDLDGVFVDCMSGAFDAWAVEIESQQRVTIDADGDGKEDDRAALDQAWEEGKRQLLENLRAAVGADTLIMINGQRPADYAKPYINGNYYEDYVDYVINHCYAQWPDVIRLYLEFCDLPHSPNCTTINASSGFWPDYEAWSRLPYDECCDLLEAGYAQLRRMRLGLTVALMADGYYAYDLNTRWRGQHWWYAEFDAPLGKALSPGQAHDDGTWRRQFEGGLAVANPAGRRVLLTLDGRFRDYTTGWTGRDFAVPAYDGRIFLPVGG